MFKKFVVMGIAGLLATVVGTGVAAASTTADSAPAGYACMAAGDGWAATADAQFVAEPLRRGSGNGNGNGNRKGGGGYGKRDGSCSTDGTGVMLRRGGGNGSGKGKGNGGGNGNGKRQRNRNGSGGNCTR